MNHLDTSPKRCAGPGHVTALPDELLSQVLRLLPFATKAAAHSVSKRWNRVLRHPTIANLWEDCELDLTASSLTYQRERELWKIADWLARRAYGIQLLLINSGPWRSATLTEYTESGFFFKQQLPYLMGQLHYKRVCLKLSFWSTGVQAGANLFISLRHKLGSDHLSLLLQILTCCMNHCCQTCCSSHI